MTALAQASAPLPRRAAATLGVWLALVVRPRRVNGSLLPPARRLALIVLVGAACIGAAMWLLDWRTLTFARTLPFAVVEFFEEITDFGQSKWFLVPFGALIVIAALLARPAMGHVTNLVLTSLIVRIEFLFLAIAVPGLFVTIVKRLIGRVRPSDLGPFAYVPWSWRPAYASMPSGHTTTAVAAAIAIGAIWPKARIPMWIFAALIAASRMAIQAHYASDVLAAAFVGAAGAILVRNYFAARRLVFAVGPSGAVHALPGPSWRRVKAVARGLLGQ